MIYTMTVVATCLGLRLKEFGFVKMEDFLCDLSIVFETHIESVFLMVKGKTYKIRLSYKLHFEDEVPEICPCRLLLIYIWILDLR